MILTRLPPNNTKYIFVFGSNSAGYHGAGAAAQAARQFGAIHGQGWGLQGQSFAIPTKDLTLTPLSTAEINQHLKSFKLFARSNPHLTFLLTPVGTGLAHIPEEQLELTNDLPGNVVYLPDLQ